MKTPRLAWILALALSLCAAASLAQVNKEETIDIALTGQITVVDVIAKTIALQGANGESIVVGVNDKTTIMADDKKLKLEDLHKGDWVAVDADRRGAMVVGTYIEVVDDPNDPNDD